METTFEKLIEYALKQRSTDIHFEYINDNCIISLRTINGFKNYYKKIDDIKLIEFLKYKANMELTDMLTPQSGSFTHFIKGKEYFFRLASIFTFSSKSFVLRILTDIYINKEISYDDKYENAIDEILDLENGLVFYSGPTGSGKTTSLYTLLKRFKNKKIYTVEDPIEIYLPGIFQLQIDVNKGINYRTAIKQILRHDPDVIVIGEIRDKNETEMAITAALTGHIVISTIHSGSCSQTIDRLKNLGITEYDITTQVKYIFNQRLITRDNKRKVTYEILKIEKDIIK